MGDGVESNERGEAQDYGYVSVTPSRGDTARLDESQCGGAATGSRAYLVLELYDCTSTDRADLGLTWGQLRSRPTMPHRRPRPTTLRTARSRGASFRRVYDRRRARTCRRPGTCVNAELRRSPGARPTLTLGFEGGR